MWSRGSLLAGCAQTVQDRSRHKGGVKREGSVSPSCLIRARPRPTRDPEDVEGWPPVPALAGLGAPAEIRCRSVRLVSFEAAYATRMRRRGRNYLISVPDGTKPICRYADIPIYLEKLVRPTYVLNRRRAWP